jgi:hypothetical protein
MIIEHRPIVILERARQRVIIIDDDHGRPIMITRYRPNPHNRIPHSDHGPPGELMIMVAMIMESASRMTAWHKHNSP